MFCTNICLKVVSFVPKLYIHISKIGFIFRFPNFLQAMERIRVINVQTRVKIMSKAFSCNVVIKTFFAPIKLRFFSLQWRFNFSHFGHTKNYCWQVNCYLWNKRRIISYWPINYQYFISEYQRNYRNKNRDYVIIKFLPLNFI